MWLLDKNVPIQLIRLLGEFGIEAVTAEAKNWGALKNGELVSAAAADGISCIVTRDRLFAESATKALKLHPSLSNSSAQVDSSSRTGVLGGILRGVVFIADRYGSGKSGSLATVS